MGWPDAFAIVGVSSSIAVIMWSIMHYGRTTVEWIPKDDDDKPKPK